MSDMTEDEWEDITHCGKLTPTITATLCMAGGGSHAWNYVLEWTNLHVDEPRVYIERFPFDQTMTEGCRSRALGWRILSPFARTTHGERP